MSSIQSVGVRKPETKAVNSDTNLFEDISAINRGTDQDQVKGDFQSHLENLTLDLKKKGKADRYGDDDLSSEGSFAESIEEDDSELPDVLPGLTIQVTFKGQMIP